MILQVEPVDEKVEDGVSHPIGRGGIESCFQLVYESLHTFLPLSMLCVTRAERLTAARGTGMISLMGCYKISLYTDS